MKRFFRVRRTLAPALLLIFAAIGCREYRSFWVNVTVVNQTSAPIREIEVNYPNASFGINALAPGAVYHYRLKVSGSGKIRAQYAGAMDKTIRVDGPMLKDNLQGQIQIALLPNNSIVFSEDLSLGQ